MKLSGRDKKLIIVLLIAAAIALPIFFIIMPLKEKIDANKKEIATLEERYAYLSDLFDKIKYFREETQKCKEGIAQIVYQFPEGIQQENTIMFLMETERNLPIYLYQVAFSGNDIMPIGTVTSDMSSIKETTEKLGQSYEGIHTTEIIGYHVPYADFKEFINYIEQWEDRLTISNLSAVYSAESGEVSGSFTINQYAITSEERKLEQAETNIDHGTHNIFSADDEDWADWLDEEEESMNQGQVVRDEEETKDKEPEKEPEKKPSSGTSSSGNNTATVTGYDVYFMLNQPQAEADAMIVGYTDDTTNKYTLKSDKNRSRLTRFLFTEEDGKYYVTYKLSYRSETHEITPEGDIVLNIYSSNRADSMDLIESSVAVVNQTNKTVQVNIINDDKKNPRIDIREKSGKIVVNQ